MQEGLKTTQFKKICGGLKRITLSEGIIEYIPVTDLAKVPLGAASTWISASEFVAMVVNMAYDVIRERIDDDLLDPSSGSLQEVIGELAINNIANNIIGHINSLPLGFAASMVLSNVRFKEGVNAGYKILKLNATEVAPRGLPSRFSGPVYNLTISVDTKGYANYNLESSATAYALDGIKVILNSWLAQNVVRIDKLRVSHGGLFFNPSSEHVIDKKFIKLNPVAQGSTYPVQLPLDLTVALNSMQLAERLETLPATDQMHALIKHSLKAVDLLEIDNNDAKSIRSAAEWCFNSHLSENETMSLLQVCFGFEALFGDGDSKSVTKSLANRCAFAVASRVSDRAKIISTFERFYQTRSKIVHGQVARLSDDEKGLLSWARLLLQQAIQLETERI